MGYLDRFIIASHQSIHIRRLPSLVRRRESGYPESYEGRESSTRETRATTRAAARRARQVAPTMPGRAFGREWKVLAAPLPLASLSPLPPPASPVPNPSKDLVVAK